MKSTTINLLILAGLGGLAVWFFSRQSRSYSGSGGATQGIWSNPNSPATPWANIARNFGVNQPRIDRTVQTIGAVTGAVQALPGLFSSIGGLFRGNTAPTPAPTPASSSYTVTPQTGQGPISITPEEDFYFQYV